MVVKQELKKVKFYLRRAVEEQPRLIARHVAELRSSERELLFTRVPELKRAAMGLPSERR